MESDTEPAAGAGAEAPPPAPEPEKKESWWETLRFFLYLFVAALVIRTFLFAPFSIPSSSMVPSLLVGDHLFVAKWSYGYSRYAFPFGLASFDGRLFPAMPERGDIVVFRDPAGRGHDVIKRVIGLPGDEVALRGGVVILNGTPLPRQRLADFTLAVSPNSPCPARERNGVRRLDGGDGAPVCAYPRFRETLPGGPSYEVLDQGRVERDDMAALTVPEGHLFVLGDNRDQSLDSRFHQTEGGVGLLPVDNVIGRATIAFWSTDGSAEWLKPWTWFTAARWGRIGETW